MAQSPDFENRLHFPVFADLPVEHYPDDRYTVWQGTTVPKAHWCLLSEIKWDFPLFSNQFWVKDRDANEYLVAFHLQNRRTYYECIKGQCKNGYTLCLMYAEKHLFFDGKIGVRVEDERVVKILPCSLLKLFELKKKSVNNRTRHCNVCGSANASLKCSKCKLFYCGKACQLLDWGRGHKTECVVLKQILDWGSFDWDRFDGAKMF